MGETGPSIEVTDNARNVFHGIIGIGQSLGAGYQAELEEETQAPVNAFRLHDSSNQYDITDPQSDTLSLVPLTEPFRRQPPHSNDVYPVNVAGMTPHSAMAQTINMISREETRLPYTTVHSCCAEGGKEMGAIKKNGASNCYAASIFEAKAIARLVRSDASQSITYDALILTHGETDAVLGNGDYASELVQLHNDYSKDLMKITGQTHKPILIVSQQHTCPLPHDVDSDVIQDQWKVEGGVICSGPKYQYQYAPTNLHFGVGGYNRLGEKYAQVYYQTVVQCQRFVPLSPLEAKFRGQTEIIMTFHVPCPPLTWDSHIPKPHQQHNQEWAAGRGFEVRTVQKEHVKIESVSIEPDGKSVAIKLGAGYNKKSLRVGYAMTGDLDADFEGGFYGGCAEGRIGHLCDSDPFVGGFSESIPCHMVHGSEEFTFEHKAFQHRAKYDYINSRYDNSDNKHEDMICDAVLLDFDDNKGKMDRPWNDTTGTYKPRFQHNQKNFLVSFYGMVVH